MWFKIVGIISVVVLHGVALGQTASQPSAGTNRWLRGRIVDYTGAPLRHRTLTCSGNGRESITLALDQDGKFSFEIVEDGRPAVLDVNATGITATRIDFGALTQSGDIGTLILQPDRTIALRDDARTSGSAQQLLSARITSADGTPYAEKIINFRDLTQAKPYQPESIAMYTLVTNRSGIFVFPAASGHEYQIYVPQSHSPLTLKALGTVEIAAGADVNLGNITMHTTSGKEAVGELIGPANISDFVTTTSAPTSQIAAAFVGAGGIVSIVHSDGKLVKQAKVKEQVDSGAVLISDDRQAVGWLVDSDFCCTSYPLQFMLIVYRPGQPPRRFRGDGRPIFGWNFVGGSKQVAFFQSFPHGDPVTHYELRDVATERLVRAWDGDVTSKRPRWVRALGN